MPKLRESEYQVQNTALIAIIAKNMVLCGIDSKDGLAERIGITSRSLYNKLRDPDRFTRRELRRLFKVLRFTEEEKTTVI